MRRWKVKAKGAIVREAAALDSAKVGTLQAKQACASDASCYVDGKERVRLVEPLAGWVSTKCLAAVREAAADADRTMVDARGRGLADVASSGADASTKCLWLDNNAIETADVSGCPGLETLVLTNNRVATVVGALDELREFLDDNRLAACPETPPASRLWLHGNGLAAPPTRARCYVERGDGAVLGAGVATLPFRNFAAAKRARHCVVAFGVERLGEWGGVLHRAPDVDAGFVFDSRRTGYADAGGFRSWLETLAETYDVLSFVGSSQGAFGRRSRRSRAEEPPSASSSEKRTRASAARARALGPAVAVVELDSAGHGADMLIPDRAALDAYVRAGLPR
ncbi:hypothetical protein JL722_1590 [Aureococcus anophagefferens]|nr:hypothetical protein JL722_1590 [Aureococcus anophagefferens]